MQKRGKRGTEERKKYLIDMPMALWVDLSDTALERETAVSVEILRRLMLKRWSDGMDRWRESRRRTGNQKKATTSNNSETIEIQALPGSRPW